MEPRTSPARAAASAAPAPPPTRSPKTAPRVPKTAPYEPSSWELNLSQTTLSITSGADACSAGRRLVPGTALSLISRECFARSVSLDEDLERRTGHLEERGLGVDTRRLGGGGAGAYDETPRSAAPSSSTMIQPICAAKAAHVERCKSAADEAVAPKEAALTFSLTMPTSPANPSQPPLERSASLQLCAISLRHEALVKCIGDLGLFFGSPSSSAVSASGAAPESAGGGGPGPGAPPGPEREPAAPAARGGCGGVVGRGRGVARCARGRAPGPPARHGALRGRPARRHGARRG